MATLSLILSAHMPMLHASIVQDEIATLKLW